MKAEVFVHTDGQLRAAHLILDYIPISKSFQAPRCVIKARDPRLHRISVTAPGFLTAGPIPEGTLTTDPIPEGTLTTDPILESIPKVAPPLQRFVEEEATSSQPLIKGEGVIVEVSDFEGSEDEFEVFNQFLPPEILLGDPDHPLPVQTSQTQGGSPLLEDMGI